MKILAFATKDTSASLGKVHLAHLLIRLICPSQEPLNSPQKISCKNAFLLFKQPFEISEIKSWKQKTGIFQKISCKNTFLLFSLLRYQRYQKWKTENRRKNQKTGSFQFFCKNTFLLFSHFEPSLLRIYISEESESIMPCPDKEQLTIRLWNKLNK